MSQNKLNKSLQTNQEQQRGGNENNFILNFIYSSRDIAESLFPPQSSAAMHHSIQHLYLLPGTPCTDIVIDYSVKLAFVIYRGLWLD